MDDPNQHQSTPSKPIPDELTTSRSCRTRKPTRYVKEIQSGIGTADGRPGKSNLPPRMQTFKLTLEIEGETEDNSQLEHAIATAISEIEVIDPQSLEEVMQRPDWPK